MSPADDELLWAYAEIARLEHALAKAEILVVTLRTPEVIIQQIEKDLSPQETKVLVRVIAGESTDEIAKGMYLSNSTIKSVIQRIFIKLDVHNRAAAAAAGVHLGL